MNTDYGHQLTLFLDSGYNILHIGDMQKFHSELARNTRTRDTLDKWFDDWEFLRDHLEKQGKSSDSCLRLMSHLKINRSLRIPVFLTVTIFPGNLRGSTRFLLQVSKRDAGKHSIHRNSDKEELIQLRAVFQSRLEGTLTTGQNGIITSFNHAAEKITGFTCEEAIGKPCWQVMGSEFCREEWWRQKSERKLLDSLTGDTQTKKLTRKNGSHLPVRVNSAPLRDSHGTIHGLVCSFQDISELQNLKSHLRDQYNPTHLIGQSPAMQRVMQLIQQVSPTDSRVLITGESGTGKELVARAIHLYSSRHTGPFEALNCAALVETLLESELFGHEKGSFTGAVAAKRGRLERAKGGTLFLDEIGDIPLSAQVKLLRILETRQFERVGGTEPHQLDARLIAATNKDLEEEVRKGNFREDFFYRINVINIQLPPLRERVEDIHLLIESFLTRNPTALLKKIRSVSAEVRTHFEHYSWPGNIRELENVLEHSAVMTKGQEITVECLPERILQPESASTLNHVRDHLEEVELQVITDTLKRFNGSRTRTAEELGMDKSTLWRKMKKYNIPL